MGFKTQSIRKWEKEWRESDWRETIPLSSGRECPECLATICSGRSWRAHWARHTREREHLAALEAAVRKLAEAVRILAVQAGHADWYPAPDETGEHDQEEPVKTGIVLGSGQLPAEMRGGDD